MQKPISKKIYFIICLLTSLFLLTNCNSSLSSGNINYLSKGQTSSLATLSFSKVQIKNNYLLFDLSLSKISPLSINFYILLENTKGEPIHLANAKTSCTSLQYKDAFLDCSKHINLYQWTLTSGKHTDQIKLPLQEQSFEENFVLKVITFNTFITKQNYKNAVTGKNILSEANSLVNTPDKLNFLENYSNLSVPINLNTNNSFLINYRVQKITVETLYLLENQYSIATENKDFIATQGSVTINPDQPLQKINIDILDDQIYEGPQSFVLTLFSDQFIFEGNNKKHILITIDDNEEAPYLQLSNFTATEKSKVQYWPVSLSWPSEIQMFFNYKLHSSWTNNAESAKDYVSSNGHITFSHNEVQKFIPVNIIVDDIAEDTENFSLLIQPSKILQLKDDTKTTYTAFIADTNNGVVPSAEFSASSLNTTKGRSINIPVELKGPTATAVKVYYRNFSQTALASKDFEDKAGVLYFPASTKAYQMQNINIKILNQSSINLQKVKKSFYLYIEKVHNGQIGTNKQINIHIL